MDTNDLLERRSGYFLSLQDVLSRIYPDDTNHRDAATVLYRLLRNGKVGKPEWVVDGLEGLWAPDDEDLSEVWNLLEKISKSGRIKGAKAKNWGFFGGEIIPFLSKHGINISTDQGSTTPVPTGAQEQADTTTSAPKDVREQKPDPSPAVSGETSEQTGPARPGTTEKAVPEVTLDEDAVDELLAEHTDNAPSGAREVAPAADFPTDDDETGELLPDDEQGEAKTPAERRARHDMTNERGCRRMILENWDTIEKLRGPNANGWQVLLALRNGGPDEKLPALKTVRNRLIDLRKEKLIPG